MQDAHRCQSLTLEGTVSVREVVNLLGLKPDELGIITINGVQSEMEDYVQPDCRLCFFPHMSGG